MVALFTSNLAEHESAMGDLWGGPLCVAEGVTNYVLLQGAQVELNDLMVDGEVPGILGFGHSYVDEIAGTIVLGAVIVTDEARQWVVTNYPDVTIRLDSLLTPIN